VKFPRPRVALLIENSCAFGRDLLLGIAEFIRVHKPWCIEFHEGELRSDAPAWFGRWQGEGVIAQVGTRSMAKAIARLGVPSVDLLGGVPEVGMPVIRSNETSVGRLAAQHLLERGFRFFAFCGFMGLEWSELRAKGFRRSVAEAGFPCQTFLDKRASNGRAAGEPQEHGEAFERQLIQWLERLPKPVGLMAGNDERGRQVINACRALGLVVPDDVAVIGAGKDELVSALADVPLSSVILNSRRIGFEAAALLDRMMGGDKPVQRGFLVEPIGVATCRSTDVISVDDPNLAKAMFFIQQNCGSEITIDNVAAFAGLSRSVLQRRFRAVLRETVHQVIVRLRLKRTREVLIATHLPLAEVASESGFKSGEYMGVVFKSHFGKAPAQFRKEFQILRSTFSMDPRRIALGGTLENRLLEKLSPVTLENESGVLHLSSQFSQSRCPDLASSAL
jgi:LacI family transcriptional regulator